MLSKREFDDDYDCDKDVTVSLPFGETRAQGWTAYKGRVLQHYQSKRDGHVQEE